MGGGNGREKRDGRGGKSSSAQCSLAVDATAWICAPAAGSTTSVK